MPALPHVTAVLAPYADFSRVPKAVLEHAAARGSQVHGACAAIVRGLWVPPLPEDAQGYIKSFRRWWPCVSEVALCEQTLTDPDYGFAGRPDLVCRIEGDEHWTVVDWKTPAAKNKLWRAQLAAYNHLVCKAGHTTGRVGSLRLKANGGPPIFDQYQHSNIDFAGFLAALTAYRHFGGNHG